MSIKHPPITPANISWQTDHAGLEVPVAEDFGDVYFSRDNGLAETQHVFLAGNQLAKRFEALNDFDTFTIGELGFGTGLNVLAVWQLWLKQQQNKPTTKKPNAKLHIITTEKFPLTKADLTRALASWTELADLSKKLIAQYPPLIAGCHRLEFPEDNVSIDLWLGDAADSLSRVAAYTPVNAWFLDGFAPKCNEQLWADSVLDQIQRLSGVGSTAATFSVAGVIKRGLAERGFDIAKVKGFGRKREMLTSSIPLPQVESGREKLNSKSKHHTCAESSRSIAIIGSGIAGLCTAHSFAKRGHEVTLIDRDKPLAGSSGNPRAMLAPKLTPLHHVHEHMHSISYLYATRFYQTLDVFAERSRSETDEQAQTSHQIIYEKTGVLDLLKTSNVTPKQISNYPEEFVSMVDAETASEIADSDLPESMYLPEAGLINPLALAEHILQHENITFVQADISKIETSDNGVTLWNADKQFTANHVVICTAHDCHLLSDQLPQPRSTRGQISWFDSDSIQPILPKTPLKYGGYCAPFIDVEGKQQHILGASFIRGTTDISVNAEEHGQSRDKLVKALPQFANIQPSNTWQGRAGLRAQMPDYLPLVGQVSESVWSLAAMGSKGFAYAPICAEVIAAQMLGEVAPLPETLVAKLNPLRFKA